MPTVRVYELARDVGVKPAALLEWLRSNGEHVTSASSGLTPPTVAKVQRGLASSPEPQAEARRSAVPVRRLAAQIAGRDSGEYVRTLEATIERDWLAHLLSPEDIRSWRSAGLSIHDGWIARACRAEGITPADLARRVEGRTVAARLRGGEPAATVALRLRGE